MIALLLLCMACTGQASEAPMPDLPVIQTLADVQAHDGQRAVVVGTYEELDVRMRQRPPAVYAGHAKVTLPDGDFLTLEPIWSDAAIRSEEERALAGKKVRVVGTVHAEAPPPPEPQATLVSPAISPVEQVTAEE